MRALWRQDTQRKQFWAGVEKRFEDGTYNFSSRAFYDVVKDITNEISPNCHYCQSVLRYAVESPCCHQLMCRACSDKKSEGKCGFCRAPWKAATELPCVSQLLELLVPGCFEAETKSVEIGRAHV